MVDRRGHAFLDPAASEPVHRQQVEAALQRLARLIAANTTADGALENRVIDLEDAPAGYTAENARDDIGAALVAGTGISITVSDVGDTITITNTASSGAPVAAQYLTLATHASLTAERVFVPSTGLSAVDGGANGNYTLSCTITQYTDEMARDALGTALVAGNGVDITVNDGADTITIDVDESELAMQAPQYVTLAATSALPNERVLTPGHGLDMTDSGAGAAVTIDVDETEFATGPGLITPGMLNNGAAVSVLGVTGGSGAARADIASGGARRALMSDSTNANVAFRAIAAADLDGAARRYIARVPPRTINTDNSAQSIITGPISIPGNTLTNNGQFVRLELFGNQLQNAAAGQSWTYLLSLAGTTLVNDAGAAFSASATRRRWKIEITLIRIDSTHVGVHYELSYNSTLTAPTTGLGDLATTGVIAVIGTVNGGVTTSIDWTTAMNLELTAQASSNSSNMEWVTEGGSVEAS